VPDVHRASFTLLVGPFGAGKTEMAEAWHMETIRTLEDTPFAPIPVWIHARELAHDALDRVVADSIGSHALLHQRGSAIVIDGLDEVSGGVAEAIARDARTFVAGSLASRVLATSRPNVILATDHEVVVPNLDEDQVRDILEVVAGNRYADYSWPPALRESIRRPFFALAAASSVAIGKHPDGKATLIRNLVEQAMQSGTSQDVIASRELFSLLTRLALERTALSGAPPAWTFETRQRALATRLVHETSRKGLEFSLPIFQQWFAAQAILEDPTTINLSAMPPSAFDEWRWPIAIAVSSAPLKIADQLILAALQMNPGAASWLLAQVVSNWFDSGYSLQQENGVPGRVLNATRAWIDSLGPAASLYFPIDRLDDPIRLGVRVRGNFVETAWSSVTPPRDEVIELTSGGDLLRGRSEWHTASGVSVGQGVVWPWVTIADRIARQTASALSAPIPLGGPAGVWHEELRYYQCRAITSNSNLYHRPMSVSDLLARIDALLAQVPPDADETVFRFGSRSVSDDQLVELRAWLLSLRVNEVRRPLPEPDVPPHQTNGWVSSLYTEQRLLDLAVEVYGRAYEAYEEAADSIFRRFDWTLRGNAYRPLGLIGTLVMGSMGRPWVQYSELPVELVQSAIAEDPVGYHVSGNGRVAVRMASQAAAATRDWYAALLPDWELTHAIETPFRRLQSGGSVLHVGGDRLSTEHAAKWLFDDLRAVNLASSTLGMRF
jgi:hypothetical protein